MLKFASAIPADKTICKLDNIIRTAVGATLIHYAALHS